MSTSVVPVTCGVELKFCFGLILKFVCSMFELVV
jgi:hypothetical protein